MQYIAAKDVKYRFSAEYSPITEVSPGEVCIVQTLDNQAGRIRSEEDLGSSDINDVNPVTGPIYIDGAKPGSVIAARIEKIEVGERGHIQLLKNYGLLRGKVESPKTKIVQIKDGFIIFNHKIRFPIKPMVGTMGVAPARERVLTLFAGRYGGNFDNKDIGEGSIVYLPVQVEGGMLSLGDIHARMGDGEVCLHGVEVSGKVTMIIDIVEDMDISWPMVETEKAWETNYYGRSFTEAVEKVADDMAYFVQKKLKVSLSEAVMLVSVLCDIRISQAAPNAAPGTGVSLRAKMPKFVFN